VLSVCRLFVGLEGLLMHLARAVHCRSVIVFGGREAPANAGYLQNVNITRTPPCSPCWRFSACDFGRQCLRDIRPAEVVRHARSLLARRPSPDRACGPLAAEDLKSASN
jgi:ADP-heptose:LPS heptosyltransferase